MKRACVIGWPIGHSRSPLIHTYWLERYGIAGSYERTAVKPADLDSFLCRMGERGLVGCNVTVPHKEAAFRHVHVGDDLTCRLGAVNTVFFAGDRLCGVNTDGVGFLRHLRSVNPDWHAGAGPACVLGAGGAARAVVAALVAEGVQEVRIANRTTDRSETLAGMFAPCARPIAWTARSGALRDCGLLVNTTTLGMNDAPPLDIDLNSLPTSATVYDIVYAPLETALLERARRRGNVCVDGLGMLLHQAAPGFELWFGTFPEVTEELRQLVIRDLEGR